MSTTALNVDSHERAPSQEQGALNLALEDGEFVVYRSGGTVDPATARSVLVVMPRSEHPRPQAIRMLENEYSLRDELDPAWAIRSLALTTREGRPALIFEDPGGELLVRRAVGKLDVGEALRVGAGLANALRQLHGRGPPVDAPRLENEEPPVRGVLCWRPSIHGFPVGQEPGRGEEQGANEEGHREKTEIGRYRDNQEAGDE